MAIDPLRPSDTFRAFWQDEPLFASLTTVRPDGTPHVVPVGVTYDPEAGLARVTAREDSAKVRNIRSAGPSGAPVSVCQFDGPRWATLQGLATVSTDPAAVADAVRRYEARYARPVSDNPDRVVIEIALRGALGRV